MPSRHHWWLGKGLIKPLRYIKSSSQGWTSQSGTLPPVYIIVMCFNLGSVHYLYRETVSVRWDPVDTDFALTLLYTSVLVCITAELLIPTSDHLVQISRFLLMQ